MPCSKSTRTSTGRGTSSMSAVIRIGCSLAADSPSIPLMLSPLARVEHNAKSQSQPAIEIATAIGREVEDIPVENRELPLELAHDHVALTAGDEEVRTQQAKQRAEHATEE